jgi:hypothetical protein
MIRLFHEIRIDWLGKRRFFIGLSIALMLAGMGTALYRHKFHPNGTDAFNLGVDFKGGTVVVTGRAAGDVTVAARGAGRAVGSVSRLTTGAGAVLLGASGAPRRAASMTAPSAARTIIPTAKRTGRQWTRVCRRSRTTSRTLRRLHPRRSTVAHVRRAKISGCGGNATSSVGGASLPMYVATLRNSGLG